MELREGWFNPESIDETVKHVIETFDPEYLREVPKSKLEKDLVKEILFLSVYTPEKEREMVLYVRTHIDELYSFAHKLSRPGLLSRIKPR